MSRHLKGRVDPNASKGASGNPGWKSSQNFHSNEIFTTLRCFNLDVCSLLAYAGHICGLGLEMGHRKRCSLSEMDTQLATDTMLSALHLGHVLLDLAGTSGEPKPTKEFLTHLASGGGTPESLVPF
jgi:hypothetical protein